jgi:hypothetical protein
MERCSVGGPGIPRYTSERVHTCCKAVASTRPGTRAITLSVPVASTDHSQHTMRSRTLRLSIENDFRSLQHFFFCCAKPLIVASIQHVQCSHSAPLRCYASWPWQPFCSTRMRRPLQNGSNPPAMIQQLTCLIRCARPRLRSLSPQVYHDLRTCDFRERCHTSCTPQTAAAMPSNHQNPSVCGRFSCLAWAVELARTGPACPWPGSQQR